jgi:prophage regulatory protein
MHLRTPQRPAQTTHGTTPSRHDDAVTVTPAKPGKLLRLPDVLNLVALKKSAWYGLIRDGKAPRPVRLAARAVAWRENEVSSWMAERTTTGSVAA